MGILRQRILPNWVCSLGVSGLTNLLLGQAGLPTAICKTNSPFLLLENPKEIF